MATATETLKGMLQMASHFYISDLKASSNDTLASKPGGAHRCPYDFTFELATLNHVMAAQLRDATPPATPESEGYMTAPPEFCNIDTACKALTESIDDIASALDGLTDEGLEASLELWGRTWSKRELAGLACIHLAYHDGQLNYVQTAGGDLAVHWG